MEQGVLRVFDIISVVVQEAQISLQNFFRLWKFGLFQEVLNILPPGIDASWDNCSSKEFNLCVTKLTIVYCQFLACFLNAFECCSQVISIVGSDADGVHILGTLVRFNDIVKVFPHKAGKCRQ